LTPPREDAEKYIYKFADVSRGAARIFLRGGAEVMEAKALKRKNCLWLE